MKTTDEDYAYFKSQCNQYVNRFGLKHWEITYTHEKEPDDDARSTCVADPAHGIAVINLTPNWGKNIDGVTREGLRMCALHEVLELLLWDVREGLRLLYAEEVVNKKIHYVIRVLENTLE